MFLDTKELMDKEIYLQLDRTIEGNTDKGYVPAYLLKDNWFLDEEKD